MTEKETGDGRDSIGGIGMDANNEKAEELAGMGWKFVQVRVTRAMQDAWDTSPASEDADEEFRNAYQAMLSAAPTPPSAPVQQSVREAFEAEVSSWNSLFDLMRSTTNPEDYFQRETQVYWEVWRKAWKSALSASPAGDKVEAMPRAYIVDWEGSLTLHFQRPSVGAFITPLYSHPQPPQPDSNKLVERVAKAIYAEWAYKTGWEPWEEGGNSFKQDDARTRARAALSQYDKKKG
jgi:hypothetical protein